MKNFKILTLLSLVSQWVFSQEWEDPYQKKLNFGVQIYDAALAQVKAGKSVKSLLLTSKGNGMGKSLEAFQDIEEVTLSCYQTDSTELSTTFEELAKLPHLHYLSVNYYAALEGKVLYLPKSFSRLTQLRGVRLMNLEKINADGFWAALPHLKNLEILNISFPSNNASAFPDAIRSCQQLKSLTVLLSPTMVLPAWFNELSALEYLKVSAQSDHLSPLPNLQGIQPILLGLTSLKSLQINGFSFDGEHLKDISTSLQVFSTTGSKVTNTTALFENINKRSTLEKLFISDCWIPAPSSTQSLEFPTLKHLSLSNLYADSLRKTYWTSVPEALLTSPNLQFLYLSNVLGEITPKNIENLRALETLNLSFNQLTQLPDLSQLGNLKALIVQNNRLTSLPKSISKLTKLETLNIANNFCKELPDGTFNSSQLKYVSINNNQISALPNGINKLRQLTNLQLSSNQLTELPSKIGEMSNLQNLAFFNNQIGVLPASIGQLKRLKYLNLGHNPIKILPKTLGNCDSLNSLQVGNCLLESLPNSLGQCTQLTYLFLANQKFLSPKYVLKGETPQSQPVRYDNKFRTLPPSLANCKKLNNYDLSNNPNWEKASLWSFVQALQHPNAVVNLSNCLIDTVPTKGWEKTQIQGLDLSQNQIRHVAPEWFLSKAIPTFVLMTNKITPQELNGYFSDYEQRLLIAEEVGMTTPKPFPTTKAMAGAYLNRAYKKLTTGDIPLFVQYMKEVARIDEKVGFNTAEIWGRYYFHTRQYSRAIDSLNIVIEKAKLRDEQFRKNTKAVNTQPYISPQHVQAIDFRAQAKWQLGDSLGAIRDYEQLVGEYKVFGPNLWGRLGVWYKRYHATAGKSGAAFDKAIGMYEMVRNAPPMVQLSVAEVYLMNDQPDKAYEYIYGLNQTNFKPDEKLLAEYLLLCTQIAQAKAEESEIQSFEKRLKTLDFKVKAWSYRLFEESLASWSLDKERAIALKRLTEAIKAQSVLVD